MISEFKTFRDVKCCGFRTSDFHIHKLVSEKQYFKSVNNSSQNNKLVNGIALGLFPEWLSESCPSVT